MTWLRRLPVFVMLLGAVGVAMMLPAIHAATTDDEHVARAFFYSGIVVLLATGLVGIVTSNRPALVTQHGQLLVLVGAYAVLPPVMALPVIEATPVSFGAAWFDMVSAFTTTGAVVHDPARLLPPSVHLWRGMAGWMGGAFILVAALAVLAPMNLGGAEVLSGRAPGQGRVGPGYGTDDPQTRIRRHAAAVVPAYAGLTALLWVALMLTGDPPMRAAVHAMSTLSTSGILPAEDGFRPGTGFWSEAAILVFLCLAFSRRFLPGLPPLDRQSAIWRDSEVKLGLLLSGAVALLLFLRHWLAAVGAGETEDMPQALAALWASVFSAVSFLTTTGFLPAGWQATGNWSGLPTPGFFLLGLAMIGGGVATTAGGVKLLRVYALFRHAERELERTIHPSSVGGRGEGARRLRGEGARLAFMFFLIFALTIGATMALLTLGGQAFEPAMLLAIAAISSTGTLAEVGGTVPLAWSDLGAWERTVTGCAMVVGRLEILAVLALTAPDGWRR
jgi:trk system potassium uptake protein TrkH